MTQSSSSYGGSVAKRPARLAKYTKADRDTILRKYRKLQAIHEADREALRAICAKLNGFQYTSYTDVLVDVRVVLTGRPRAEIEAEHTVVLDAEASAKLAEILARSTGTVGVPAGPPIGGYVL